MEFDVSNISAETPEAAEPVRDVENNAESQEETQLSAETPEAAEPAGERQRRTADAAFAEMRRRYTEAQAQNDRMKAVLGGFGFRGQDGNDIADEAYAHLTGEDVSEVRQKRLAQEEAKRNSERTQAELSYYRREAAQKRMSDDLKAIRRIDPSVKSLDDLGGEFFKLIRNGISGETAFMAIKAKEAAGQKKAPPKIGAVNSKTAEEKDFYSAAELDSLSRKDLDDPKVLEKALKSLTKL